MGGGREGGREGENETGVSGGLFAGRNRRVRPSGVPRVEGSSFA